MVDYLGLADQLKKALANYPRSGGQGRGTFDQAEAVAVMQEKYEVVCGMMHGFDYRAFLDAPTSRRMAGVRLAMEHIPGLEDGKKRYLQAVTALSKAFALAVPHEEALAIRDEVGFFQAVRAGPAKTTPTGGRSPEEIDTAVRQIVSRAVAGDEAGFGAGRGALRRGGSVTGPWLGAPAA